MITHEELQELIAFDGGDSQVFSVYLNTDTGLQSNETIKLQARSMMKEARVAPDDMEKIEKILLDKIFQVLEHTGLYNTRTARYEISFIRY